MQNGLTLRQYHQEYRKFCLKQTSWPRFARNELNLRISNLIKWHYDVFSYTISLAVLSNFYIRQEIHVAHAKHTHTHRQMDGSWFMDG